MQTEREPLTIRFPAGLLTEVRASREPSESLNDFVVSAVDRELRRRRALGAHATILAVRERVRQRTGLHPDPVPLIRDLREGLGRRE